MSLLRSTAASQLGRPLAGLVSTSARQTAQPVVASRPAPHRDEDERPPSTADPAANGVAAPFFPLDSLRLYRIHLAPTRRGDHPTQLVAQGSATDLRLAAPRTCLPLCQRPPRPPPRQSCPAMHAHEHQGRRLFAKTAATAPSLPNTKLLHASKLEDLETVLTEARKAKANGSTRFCMGAAWREVGGRKRGFNRISTWSVRSAAWAWRYAPRSQWLTTETGQAAQGSRLTAYNHNLDTSREYYGKVVTTRSYDDRIGTIANVREAGISVCLRWHLGLGEEHEDRVGLIWEMSTLPETPSPSQSTRSLLSPVHPWKTTNPSPSRTCSEPSLPPVSSSRLYHSSRCRSSSVHRVRTGLGLPSRCQRHLHR